MLKYCPYCGVQNVEGNNFCVGCAKALGDKNPPIEHPISNSTPTKKTSGLMGGIIAIILIVSIVLFATTYVYLSGTVIEYDGYNESDEDFMDWFYSSAEEIQYDSQMIGKYSGEYNLYSLEMWFEELEDDTDRYPNDIIYDYPILSKYQSLRNEYQEALEDFNLAGYYGRIGAKYENGADIRKSAEYLDKGTDHINRCTDIIYELN